MAEGLSFDEAKHRLEEYGPNSMEEDGSTTFMDIFLRQFSSVLVWILIIATGISFFAGEMLEFYFILGIIVIIVSMGFIQEMKAEQAMEELESMSEPTADVIREGEIIEVDKSEVVPGDVLKLEMGDSIPADAKVLKSVDISMDESIITGESEAVNKERGDKLYSGTTVVHGRGEARVTATGMDTELGKIAGSIQEKEEETPLQRKVRGLGKNLGILALVSSFGLLLLGLTTGAPFAEIMLVTLALAVASIPEGLPLTMTLTLAIGTRDLAKKNAIVRKLVAVEGLGSTTVICTDKTGTLTRNEMSVEKVYTVDGEFDSTIRGYSPNGEILKEGEEIIFGEHNVLYELVKAGVLCNNASLVHNEEYKIHGSPTEGALITMGHALGMRKEECEEKCPRVEENIFTSKRKRMSVVTKEPEWRGEVAYMKGAPEVVLERCNRVLLEEGEKELDDEMRNQLLDKNEDYTNDALRVLALAYKSDFETHDADDIESDMVFLGFVAMRDPPRQGVKETLESCRDAGINVKMVTGDNPTTASAIAERIGLTENPEVLTGEDMKQLEGEELSRKIRDTDIFARTMPEDKYTIVNSLQEDEEVVAMTGDGVNDAPAVKKADIGVGMGLKGTDVTKEASDIVLQDDRFETLVTAIKEGRRIFDNIEKFTTYLISGNFTEVILIALGILFLGFEFLPLIAIQILFLNVIGEEFPAISLGMDPAEEEIMERPPRATEVGILHRRNLFFTVSMAFFNAILGFLIFIAVDPSKNLDLARTVVFTADTMMIIIYSINFRSLEKTINNVDPFKNKWIIASAVFTIGLLVLTVYFPPLAEAFSHSPLELKYWGVAIAASAFTMFFIEMLKKYAQKYMDTSYMWKKPRN